MFTAMERRIGTTIRKNSSIDINKNERGQSFAFFLALMTTSLMTSGSISSGSIIFSYFATSPVKLSSDFLG